MSDHYYTTDGQACHFIDKKDSAGSRPTTIRDARKLNLLPSVTTILKTISKPQLERWKMIQAATAVLTSPRRQDEGLDAFMERVLFTDKEQDQEAAAAADLGGRIHAALEGRFKGEQIDETLLPWIQPIYEHIMKRFPTIVAVETVLVGDGYAGKTDLIVRDPMNWEWVIDFKTTKKLPEKGSWPDHVMQTSAYLKCRRKTCNRHANVYISTLEPGKFIFHDNGDFDQPYRAFKCLVNYWQIVNKYVPDQSQQENERPIPSTQAA